LTGYSNFPNFTVTSIQIQRTNYELVPETVLNLENGVRSRVEELNYVGLVDRLGSTALSSLGERTTSELRSPSRRFTDWPLVLVTEHYFGLGPPKRAQCERNVALEANAIERCFENGVVLGWGIPLC
jgi:hypothetical protein